MSDEPLTEAEKALKDAAEELYGIASQDMPVGGDEVLEAMKKFEEAYAHALAEKQRDYAEKEWAGDDTASVLRRVIAGRMADLIDPKITKRAPGRHLVVNPEPLKMVKAKPGDRVIETKFVLARRWGKRDRLLAASIHRDYCRKAPRDGTRLSDGSKWTLDEITRDQVSRSVAWVADQHVEASVSCRSCGGWSVT